MGKYLNIARRVIEENIQSGIAAVPSTVKPKKSVPELDLFDPMIKKVVRLDLLSNIERQAFEGWFLTIRKSKLGQNEEKAKQVAWELLIESMESMYKRGGGRYSMKRNEDIK